MELTGPRAADPRNPLAARRPPLAWARELVTSVVDAAMHASGGSRWIILEGGVAYHGTDENGQGLWDGVGGFLDPTDAQALDNFRPSQLEGTGNKLQTLDLRLVDQLAAGDPRTIGAVDEARWHHSVRVQNNPAQRVALHVRAFEQALPIARGARWNDATQLYFQGFWAWDRFDGALQSAALSTRFWISLHDPQTAEQLITWADDEGVHLDRFVGAADQAHAALGRFQGDARITRRGVKQVSTWSKDPTLARLRLAKLASRFDILLARTVRQRNAIIHGVQTDPDVVASVDRFVARLAYYITAGALRSATVGEDLADGLERSRAQSNRMLWRLEQRTPLSKVWDDADIDEDAGPSGGEGHRTEDDGGGANDPDYADDAQGDPGPGVADD